MSRTRRAVGVASAAVLICGVCALGLYFAAAHSQVSSFWDASLRSESYRTAVDLALASADRARDNAMLVGRDFTQTRYVGGHPGTVPIYEACSLGLQELATHTGLIGGDCTVSPGLGPKPDARCPEDSCVAVLVRDVTWADPLSRKIIVDTITDHALVCRDAARHGPNPQADTAALRCGREPPPFRVAVQIAPRVARPCFNVALNMRAGKGYRPICANPAGRLQLMK